MPEPLYLTLPAVALAEGESEDGEHVFSAALIKEGIFTPAVGHFGERVRFRKEVLKELSATMEGKKVDLNHFQDVESEVGFVRNVKMDGDTLRGDIVLQEDRAQFQAAIGFVKGRLGAGMVPNVSIEIRNPVFETAPEEEREWDLDLTGGELDGVALVSTGACSDADGCGIGLATRRPVRITVLATRQDKQGDTDMGEHDDPAPCTHCGGGKDAELKALREKAGKVEGLEKDLTETRASLEAVTEERDTLREKVDGFEEADRKAMLEAVQAAAPKDTDLEKVLGCKVEEANTGLLTIALNAFRASGARTGLSGGRHTHATTRSREGNVAADERLTRARERLGLSEEDIKRQPAQTRANTARLLAGRPGNEEEA